MDTRLTYYLCHQVVPPCPLSYVWCCANQVVTWHLYFFRNINFGMWLWTVVTHWHWYDDNVVCNIVQWSVILGSSYVRLWWLLYPLFVLNYDNLFCLFVTFWSMCSAALGTEQCYFSNDIYFFFSNTQENCVSLYIKKKKRGVKPPKYKNNKHHTHHTSLRNLLLAYCIKKDLTSTKKDRVLVCTWH
jgi:hypothetical protein